MVDAHPHSTNESAGVLFFAFGRLAATISGMPFLRLPLEVTQKMWTSLLFTGFVAVGSTACSFGQDRAPDPTWLHRFVPAVREQPSDLTTPTCRYRPIFGAGDSESRVLRGIVRYGEATVDPGGMSAVVNYPDEEQVYFVLDGEGTVRYGAENARVRRYDFMYLPPGVEHGLSKARSLVA